MTFLIITNNKSILRNNSCYLVNFYFTKKVSKWTLATVKVMKAIFKIDTHR